MLIGPSLTLAELEEKLKDRLYEIKMDLPKAQKEFARLREEFKRVPRIIVAEKDGEEVETINPDFIKLPDQLKAIEEKIKGYQEQQEFLEEKLEELETIEDRSKGRGNINKEKEKITLSLNDCLKLGIE
ncbi:hypothetical protein C2I27_04305 [Priestia megaterium]|uniref:hypothetical protein n=1 Tax=Priestia megaterium TaxID=1404 RepID=UPI000D512B2C|nr:hypothetical protein [Priestia megaterium]PVC75114.1 hypothetical protein C2I27_04305 [Priestia megaterium]